MAQSTEGDTEQSMDATATPVHAESMPISCDRSSNDAPEKFYIPEKHYNFSELTLLVRSKKEWSSKPKPKPKPEISLAVQEVEPSSSIPNPPDLQASLSALPSAHESTGKSLSPLAETFQIHRSMTTSSKRSGTDASKTELGGTKVTDRETPKSPWDDDIAPYELWSVSKPNDQNISKGEGNSDEAIPFPDYLEPTVPGTLAPDPAIPATDGPVDDAPNEFKNLLSAFEKTISFKDQAIGYKDAEIAERKAELYRKTIEITHLVEEVDALQLSMARMRSDLNQLHLQLNESQHRWDMQGLEVLRLQAESVANWDKWQQTHIRANVLEAQIEDSQGGYEEVYRNLMDRLKIANDRCDTQSKQIEAQKAEIDELQKRLREAERLCELQNKPKEEEKAAELEELRERLLQAEKRADTAEERLRHAPTPNLTHFEGAAYLVKVDKREKLPWQVMGCFECHANSRDCDDLTECRNCSESGLECRRWRCALHHIFGDCDHLACNISHNEMGWVVTPLKPEW